MPPADQRIATIHQIVPAQPGWRMEYLFTTHGEHDSAPVAVWALAEDSAGDRFVVGMAPDMSALEPDEQDPHPSVTPDLFPPDESFRRYVFEDPE